ncbi:MAG: bi-domain-containing oxidoreductase [Aggregatilineales bacterium]
MKQVAYLPRTGAFAVMDVPSPVRQPGAILVRTAASALSAGTERAALAFGRQTLLQKAKARPDLVRKTLERARRDGVAAAFNAARERLDRWSSLGYSLAGTVIAVGDGSPNFQLDDRVACAGSNYAVHAEIVSVPCRLAVHLPDNVSFEPGAFATLGAIALQGVRQSEAAIGHDVAVIGLGMIGQLTTQLLKAAGCRVAGIEPNPARAALAQQLGADAVCSLDQIESLGAAFTAGRGFDAVILTADSRNADLLTLAARIARDRAIVVIVGAFPLSIPRTLYYEKELQVRLSRSYGPGRYDPDYEQRGRDYPIGYVRFTEGRNLETFVRLLASRAVQVEPLITHRLPIADALHAYELIGAGNKAEPAALGIVLTYPVTSNTAARIELRAASKQSEAQTMMRLGVVGAGNFANATFFPALRDLAGIERVGVASGSGLSARQAAERFGFAYCADWQELLADSSVNWLAILTRHDQHAAQAIAGMRAGKDIFVEKPLALTRAELLDVIRVRHETGRRLMVGFNRRFAPFVQMMRNFRPPETPIMLSIRVNAGSLPATHWTRQPEIGGGRIIGESCHFVDLLCFLTGSAPRTIFAVTTPNPDVEMALTLTFVDGSVGTVMYATGGDTVIGKERIEWFGGGRAAILDDYRTLTLIAGGKQTRKRAKSDKGHRAEWETIVAAARTGSPTPISVEELVTTHLATLAAIESARSGQPIDLVADVAAFWGQMVLSAPGASCADQLG